MSPFPKKSIATAAVFFAVSVYPAHRALCQDVEKLYASFSLGWAQMGDEYSFASYSGSPLTLQMVGGYQFEGRWSIEGMFQSFDDVAAHDLWGSGTARFDVSSDISTVSVRARMTVPLSDLFEMRRDFRIFGALGLHRTEFKRSGVVTTSGSAFSQSDSDFGLALGGGVVYNLGKFGIRGSIDWLDLEVAPSKGLSATVGVELRF